MKDREKDAFLPPSTDLAADLAADLPGLPGAVLRWFDRVKRDLPWRRTGDAYAIWVSETMLQQTQVETVKPFYDKFLRRFPTVGDLAGAELSEVLRVWAGLGYYRRARFLHLAARVVVERYGGKVPGEVAQLLELPGVGRYTAGAVASMAYGKAVAAVDGNVLRVLARVGGVEGDIRSAQVQKGLWVMAEGLVGKLEGKLEGKFRSSEGRSSEGSDEGRGGRVGDFNQGLMELGAMVCRPRDPGCGGCPVRGWCRAFLTQKTAIIPWKSAGKPKITQSCSALCLLEVNGTRGTGAKD